MPADEAETIIQRSARVARERQNAPARMDFTPARAPRPEVSPDEYDDRERERERRAKISRYLADCGIGDSAAKRYVGLRLDCWQNVPEEIEENGKRWPARALYRTAIERASVVLEKSAVIALIGRRGPGKTAIACALVQESCRRERSGMYIDAMDYTIALQETFDDHARLRQSQVENKFLRYHLLALDALEERADTAWNDRMLIRLIDKRYKLELPTILISNEDEPAFRARIGPTISDRIFDDGGGVIACNWPSLRGRVSVSTGLT